jgi:hypothetical protein
VNGELERIWKEAVWPDLRYSFSIFLEGLSKSTKISVRIANLRIKILTRGFQNTKQIVNHSTTTLGVSRCLKGTNTHIIP